MLIVLPPVGYLDIHNHSHISTDVNPDRTPYQSICTPCAPHAKRLACNRGRFRENRCLPDRPCRVIDYQTSGNHYPSTGNTFALVIIHIRRYLENSIEMTTNSSKSWNARKKAASFDRNDL